MSKLITPTTPSTPCAAHTPPHTLLATGGTVDFTPVVADAPVESQPGVRPDPPNPLFDPWSDYNRYRRGMVPLEKLRGFYVEDALKVTAWAARPSPSVGDDLKVPVAEATEVLVVAARSGRVVEGRVELVRGQTDGREWVRVIGSDLPHTDGERACRLYVITPAARASLMAAAGCPTRLVAVFDPTVIAARPPLAQRLSAVPDADGVVADGVLRNALVTLHPAAARSRKLPDGVSLVLAIDTDGGEA